MKTAEEQVAELNEKHFVAQEGGKTRVYNEKYDSVMERNIITSSSFEDFRNLYSNKYISVEIIEGDNIKSKSYKLGQYWLGDTDRRQYDQIVFEPGKKLSNGNYNLWRGFNIEEDENGKWDLLQQHILDNVCCGNVDYFNYYLDWWANAVQHPDQQANVAVVLKGKRGGGKGSAIGYFAELFGQHHIHVFSSRQVTGNFNSHLRDAVILFSDEAVYAGNTAEESVLKGLITERVLNIESKGVDLVQVKNCLHVIMSTNNEWAVPAGPDERRFFVLDMKDDEAVKQNTAYFSAIKKQMDKEGGRSRLLWDLKRRDISKFDSYKAPNTAGLLEQKMISMEGHMGWWHQALVNGCIIDGFDWEEWLPFSVIHDNYDNYCNRMHKRWNKKDAVRLGEFIGRMVGTHEIHRSKRNVESYFVEAGLLKTKSKQLLHYKLPPLQGCRLIFEKESAQQIKWPPLLKLVGDDTI